MDSPTSVNVKFRAALERLRPAEHHIDMLEAAHTELVKKLIPAAVIFGLKTKAKHRGWNEREYVVSIDDRDELGTLRGMIEVRAKQLGISYLEELAKYLAMFEQVLVPEIDEKLRAELEAASLLVPE